MTNYLSLSIKEIHELLVEKKITPLLLVNEAIKRAENNDCNAFEYIDKDVFEIAKSLVEPEKDNLLWGMPFVIKDNISTKNVLTCASSNILDGYVPIFNATIIDKLIKKKAIPIAKTTMDELALGGSGTTGHKGATLNPYNNEHIIGGSSCGSAVAVSANIVPFSLGSDTGDSIRKPASYAGIVGFKPTWGRISRFGLFPFANSLDTLGFFTNNVEDCFILLDATTGYDKKDSTSIVNKIYENKIEIDNCIKTAAVNKTIRIAVIKEIIDSIKNKSIVNEFKNILEELEKIGINVNYVSIEKNILRTIFPTYFIISCAESVSNNANLDGLRFGKYSEAVTYQESVLKAREKGFSKYIKKRFIFGNYALLKENQEKLYLRAKKNRNRIIDIFNNIFMDNDIVFLPASPDIAPKINSIFDKDYFVSDEYLIADNHLIISNFTGSPSITIPAGFFDKMPFGFNLTGRIFEDKKLLNIAKIIEDIIKFKQKAKKI
ncbi:MAG: Asp-tRNA(Asn)/Glu-tRNA(Gln) amidotransferase subunit GatA [Bacilli bacterium]|nr:Asp-tRNA(Asn)/Glu-tRNA(Gln) amidotransferase subunit GatA [Bacilli bacterium]